jgi:dTDP-4-amino-4,6-dideoxygalactose transaminase
MKDIPFFTFANIPTEVREGWRSAANSVIAENVFIGGERVKDFEKAWADFLGVEHVVGVGNGLDAIVLALLALDIGPGDLVAVPSHTFIATWLAVSKTGATPIGVDVDEFGQMDLLHLESLNLPIRAVIPVHMHGMAVDMPRLIDWARTREILVIEDCAQAHGKFIHGKHAGTWGDAGAFSFYPTKNLGALGDAGAVCLRGKKQSDILRSIANYGSNQVNKYLHERIGFNSRLDPLQAAILRFNLEFLNEWNARRGQIAARYLANLDGTNHQIKPLCSKISDSVWHHFVVMARERNHLSEYLSNNGVKTDIHYPFTASSEFNSIKMNHGEFSGGHFPMAEKIASQGLSLPMHPWLEDSEVDYIVNLLNCYKSAI